MSIDWSRDDLGYRGAVDLLRGAGLVCIDEFELDDPGDTMVMTRLLRELVASGSRIAATSNTPPHALGEGRFAARDFLREITAMAADFDVLRMDGVDFRQRALDGHARVLEEDAYAQAIASAASRSIASDDAFSDLVAHLARVHPSRYARMIDDIGLIGVRGAVPLADQSAALRWVAFVDRVYDANPGPVDGDCAGRGVRTRDAGRRISEEVLARRFAPDRADSFGDLRIDVDLTVPRNLMFTGALPA